MKENNFGFITNSLNIDGLIHLIKIGRLKDNNIIILTLFSDNIFFNLTIMENGK